MQDQPNQLQLICNAALGWLELGNWLEAYNELENLPPKLRAHPEALKLYCRVWFAAGKWEDLVFIAEGAASAFPQEPEFWWQAAWARHMQGDTENAVVMMLSRSTHLPVDAEFCYRGACLFGVLHKYADACVA